MAGPLITLSASAHTRALLSDANESPGNEPGLSQCKPTTKLRRATLTFAILVVFFVLGLVALFGLAALLTRLAALLAILAALLSRLIALLALTGLPAVLSLLAGLAALLTLARLPALLTLLFRIVCHDYSSYKRVFRALKICRSKVSCRKRLQGWGKSEALIACIGESDFHFAVVQKSTRAAIHAGAGSDQF
jgi:hypothetical protein